VPETTLAKFRSSTPPRLLMVHHTTDGSAFRNERIDLILSPAYYWVRREEVGALSPFAARKIAPSIFHGLIPEGEYHYRVMKTDVKEEALFFAYDEAEIARRLKAQGFDLSLIRNVYLAQNELSMMTTPLLLDDESALIMRENIIVAVPRILCREAEALNPEGLKLSKFRLNLRSVNAFGIKSGQLYGMSAVVLIALLGSSVEYWRLSGALEAYEMRQVAAIEEAKLPNTSFQRKAIKKGLIKRVNAHEKLKKTLVKVMRVPKNKKETLERLRIDGKRVRMEYKLSSDKEIKVQFPKASIDQKEGIYSVEVRR